MVALPFYRYQKRIDKPLKHGFVSTPQTLGEHIRKKRILSGISQRDLCKQWGLNKDCLTLWEMGHNPPTRRYYPRILDFLRYYPFDHETTSLAGKLQQVLNCNGWSHRECAEHIGVDPATVTRLLRGGRTFVRKDDIVTRLWNELPDYLKTSLNTNES